MRLCTHTHAFSRSDSVTDIVSSILGPILGGGVTTPSLPSTIPSTIPSTFPPSTPSSVPSTSTTPSKTTTSGPTGLVFSYAPAADVTVDISTCPDSSIDTFLFLIEGGPSPSNMSAQKLAAYNDDAGPRVTCSTIPDVTLKGGKTYFIVVSQNNAYITTKQGAQPVVLTVTPK